MAQTKDLIKALQILDPEGKGFVEAAHDVLFLPCEAEETNYDGGKADLIKRGLAHEVEEYGDTRFTLVEVDACYFSDEYDCWVMYA